MATAIYVHVPYCISKCPYCDFASIPADGSIEAYLDALQKELIQRRHTISAAATVYVGGGTPSILNPDQMSRLFHELQAAVSVSPAAEVTIEANPCSLSAIKIEALVAAGVNRVSLGAQSFVESELRQLDRRHRVEDTQAAVSLLRRHGIHNINLDLIYAIPSQTTQSWRHSLRETISLRPEHVSAYCLTFEAGTPFASLLDAGALRKKSEDQEIELYQAARDELMSAGYDHYEISNFARPDKRSAHNLTYWANQEYLGIGASAVSYLDGKRISNIREPSAYIGAMNRHNEAVAEIEEVPPRMQAIETMIQRLRLSDGVDCGLFASRFGVDPAELFGDSFTTLLNEGLLEYRDELLRSTFRGWQLANEVALRLLP